MQLWEGQVGLDQGRPSVGYVGKVDLIRRMRAIVDDSKCEDAIVIVVANSRSWILPSTLTILVALRLVERKYV